MPTKAKKPRRVHLRVLADHVAKQFREIDKTAVELFQTKQRSAGQDPEAFVLSLPFNDQMCEKYGGCEYRSKCNLSPDQIVSAHAARFDKNRGAATTEPGETFMAIDMIARMKALKSGGSAEPVVTPLPVQLSGPVGGASGYELSDKQLDGQGAADAAVAKVSVGINPPESALAPAPAVGSIAGTGKLASPQATVSVTEEKPKKGPGRPKKEETPPASSDEFPVSDTPATYVYFTFTNKTPEIEYSLNGNLLPGETYPALLKRLGLS